MVRAKNNGYAWATPAQRSALDADVKARLNRSPQTRGMIAAALGIGTEETALRAVSASLARGVRDGWADPQGERGQAMYRSAPRVRS